MLEKTGKILAIDDNEDILFSLKLLLKQHVEKIILASDPEKIPELIKSEEFDVILLDMNFRKDAISGKEGFYWLDRILAIKPDAVVIFITAYGDAEKAVNAIKSGATDFIIKPWQNEKLLATISSSMKLARTRTETVSLKQRNKALSEVIDQPFKDFIGISPGMQDVFKTIQKVAKTDASILILGENGTGKEVVARSLHRSSLRSSEVFVSVDLGAIPETLFESELFGHEKGAFTDAKNEKPGRFEIANDGTLFLDEIGNLSLPLQSKLLTVLERREVMRVGSTRSKPFDIRLVCATNSNIHDLAGKDQFRQDLLYRINTVEIHLPPLRDRVEDIPLLCDHFLKMFVTKYNKPVKSISAAAAKKLQQYSWPGNIRELQHAIERAIIMTDSGTLQPEDFIMNAMSGKKTDVDIQSHNLDDVEKAIINKVLKKYNGNISHAAKELGLTRTSLYRRLEKHGI
ncbi:MAG: sigma-54-dependent Fis family transcriptional regulator [Bacteroidetes bacterium GWF2_38_335]|nr:MAG: sigma-54-dependent Fis family transcriptional regulator [Bacteroidetes bacterium GWF2_38_335]OFY79519.1 MAG: sigma-54-dependent Fis family transcriptional regulator [Bacteroidetes bacterium RIFOXYA12_FULL_38_20]HBS86542.1 sigma-54-dependent Fis family transcriptional regulator [Bacteroidales bacterium]